MAVTNMNKQMQEQLQQINNVLGENKKLSLNDNKKLIDKYCSPKIKNKFHILEINNELMTCTLNYTNIQTNANKFMILQLLKNDNTDSFAIFSRGGRVGFTGKYTTDLYIALPHGKVLLKDSIKKQVIRGKIKIIVMMQMIMILNIS